MTFTTAAFGRSSSWLFEASPYRATPKGLPSSFAQLRITVWTGDARDTRMIEVVTVDAASTIRLLQSIAALYPMLALIHVFLDNARYHHARMACPTRVPDQAAFLPVLLPASQKAPTKAGAVQPVQDRSG